MSTLPLAVRVAAGIAATAVEWARRLPQDVAELPVTAMSRAMQVSMRVQQQVTELAIKGDNAIALLRTPAEDPPWAVFDEDVAGDGAQETSATVYPLVDEPVEETAVVVVEPEQPDEPDVDALDVDARDLGAPDVNALDAAAEVDVTDIGTDPGVLPGYRDLSLASVRARLRALDADALQQLLDYEVAHDNRSEFVRMLTNRISTVRSR